MKEKKSTSIQLNGAALVRRAIIIGVSAIISLIIGLLVNYLTLPAQTIHSSGWWWFWIMIGIVFTIAACVMQIIYNKITYEDEKPIIGIICGILTGVFVVVMFVTSIPGWKCTHAEQYANLIKIEEGNFEKDIPQMSNEAVIVDMKTAQRLGDRTIGTIKHASWYEADDEYDLIEVNGEYYRISSIKYNGIFAYWKASSEGIPGYILVNAKTQEAKYVPLEEGMKYHTIGIAPEDAQFLETRKYQVNEICRIFRVPPHLIGDLERATFSNIEHQSIEFVQHTIRPWLVRWEQEISRSLLDERERLIYFAKFNVDGLLRGDYKSRMEGYAIGRQNGWLSANDIRRLEDLPPIPEEQGGDEYLVNGNMTTVAVRKEKGGSDGKG